jgi:hypothetical protein
MGSPADFEATIAIRDHKRIGSRDKSQAEGIRLVEPEYAA